MEKKKKRFSTKNLKLSTRITYSTILGIIIPVVVIAAFSSIFINSISSYFDFGDVNSNSYSIINKLQWDQTVSSIAEELASEDNRDEALREIKKLAAPIERLGTVIYIEGKDGEFYSTTDKEDVYSTARAIFSDFDMKTNTNYFSESGVVIVSHSNAADQRYTMLIANGKYTVTDPSEQNYLRNFRLQFFGKTGFAIMLIAAIFILSAVVLSFITSSSIIKPIRKLEEGANELANGNLDYFIDYESTNEIGVTVASFNKMTSQLKASLEYQREIEESRRNLVAGVAHDLRTPLTSVKGYVEGLMDGIADTPEKQERYLKTIYKSTTAMEKLLDELLVVSKLETGVVSLDLHKININDFLEDCYSYMKVSLDQRGFEFIFKNSCSPDACVMLDSDQFERVIRNILSNSVRYCKSGVKGRIEMSAHEYKRNIIISIADNGIGMSAENIPKIFDSFYRADPARTKVSEGSGLGLYICKQIVEHHGGRIWATGEEGKGLTVHISLDTVPADNEASDENKNETTSKN